MLMDKEIESMFKTANILEEDAKAVRDFERRTIMNREELFSEFSNMFPEMSERVVNYRKIGSRVIVLFFEDSDQTLVFMYYNPSNWQLGTKLWRKRPEYGNGSIGRKKYDEYMQANVDE